MGRIVKQDLHRHMRIVELLASTVTRVTMQQNNWELFMFSSEMMGSGNSLLTSNPATRKLLILPVLNVSVVMLVTVLVVLSI